MRGYMFTFAALLAFWLIITESTHADSVIVGVFICAFITWYNRDIIMSEKDFPPITARRIAILLHHAGQMLIEVLKANIQVVRIVLSPKLDFDQGLVIFTPQLSYQWNEVLFGNSITLTPGTLTLDIEADVYTVHILDMANADSLVGWSIQDNLRRLEEEDE